MVIKSVKKITDILRGKKKPKFLKKIWGLFERQFLLNDSALKTDFNDGLLRIRITNKCNAKCRYCGLLSWSKEEQNQSMNSKWLYDYCKPLYEKMKLVLITGGDALVAKESYNYCTFLSENYPHATIFTESNGIAFSKKWQKFAMENLFRTHFSINASTAEVYEKGVWAGSGAREAFEKVQNNLKSYMELLKENNLEVFAPSVSMVINNDTACDVEDFIKMSLRLRAQLVMFYFDYTENDMNSAYFGSPDIIRPVLKKLMEIERVLAKKFFVYFRLWIPVEESEAMQKLVDSVPIDALREKYCEIIELAQGRSMQKEFEQRQRIRKEFGKKTLTFDEDWTPTIHLTEINGKKVCFAPWAEIDLYPNGRLDFCGWFKPTLNLQDFIKDDKVSWDEILNSVEFLKYRKNILNGNFEGCMTCCPMNSIANELTPVHKYGYERKE